VLVNLLVVQEEPPVASFIKRGLEAEGFVVRTACDGAEGLEMSRSTDLDLIVLDLVLPTVTGEEILARLRAAGSSVPVIVLTSSDAAPDQVAILNAGADDYVTRPCSFSELLARSGRGFARRIRRCRPRSPTGASPSTSRREMFGSVGARSTSRPGSSPCSRR
jgi:DNA-binding response OmpR family regulator